MNNEMKELFGSKVGYDWRIKMMLSRVAPHLYSLLEETPTVYKRNWSNVVRLMFRNEGADINRIVVNGYYNRVKSNLKDIDVIRYNGKELVKGSNWDRFYSDEDWSWFVMNTDSGAKAKIVK